MVSETLLEGARRFASPGEAGDSPLARALFAIAGVSEVLVSGGTVTVTKSGAAPWQAVGKQVGAAIRSSLGAGAPPVAAVPAASSADDEVL